MTTDTLAPNRLYRADDLADLFQCDRDSIYRIPVRLLPRVRVGPRGGATRFWGRDVLAYLERMEVR